MTATAAATMSSRIYTDGHEIDGSWVLRIYVTDLNVERSLRVKGELHIGGVMLRLVEDLDIAMDWSDHALWWPARNHWLTRTRSTLDQYGVAADAILHFTPMHKILRVQLPDMRYIDCRVDFSVKTFNAVINLCKELGIRHPEELSFCKPLEANHLKYNLKDMPIKKKTENHKNGHQAVAADTNTFIASTQSPRGSINSLDRSSPFMCGPMTPNNYRNHSTPIGTPVTHTSTWKRNNKTVGFGSTGSFNANNSTMSLEALNGGLSEHLLQSPSSVPPDVRARVLRPRSLVEKARMNVAWLDSSLSIMEQAIHEYDTLRLRFKFYSFYDLNPKTDGVRINMIYEQAKWQLLAEEIDCTEEEMLMFAALQVQTNLQSNVPQSSVDMNGTSQSALEDDIDAALTDLQVTLEGSSINTGPCDITQIPELCDYLRFFKPKRFTLKAFKRYWFTCRDLQLRLFKGRDDTSEPVHVINLRGCEVTPDVHLAQGRYGIRLEVPGSDGMTEMWIRCDNEQQYAKWMAACRLASKGRSLADASYESEVSSIVAFLQLQRPAPAPAINPNSLGDIVPENYVAPRFVKKFKNKLVQRILEAHANVKDLSLIEAKMNYIKAWQNLPEYGISLFIVRFNGKNKDELLGIANNRIMRMDIHSGDHIKTWRFNTMKAWNVNWEVKHMMVQFEEENIIFECQSADCKVLHEFIGGYIFLSMRSKEVNQTLNEELFHKLTGGWD
ncbi:unc-112-related protein-like isoform X1 [Trichogramma pretiosum]|uniref:unc-112-related protein-like isoform X1 n=2 Tax=Trichogramma pretiosum TaxID=7493 RepID=UPI0006C9A901|nr:unc-112-related protein-like isoform X1 [Trichogramma pretiosum]